MEKHEFVSHVLFNLSRMSRTAQTGGVNAAGRKGRPPPLCSPTELRFQVEKGIKEGAEFLWELRGVEVAHAGILREIEGKLSTFVMGGLAVTSLYRTVQTERTYGVAPEDIRQEMERFFEKIVEYLNGEREVSPAAFAAWMEWELDTRIHPYADGCGRMAKLLSAFFCLLTGIPLPTYDSYETYYRFMNTSFESFREHYLAAYLPLRSEERTCRVLFGGPAGSGKSTLCTTLFILLGAVPGLSVGLHEIDVYSDTHDPILGKKPWSERQKHPPEDSWTRQETVRRANRFWLDPADLVIGDLPGNIRNRNLGFSFRVATHAVYVGRTLDELALWDERFKGAGIKVISRVLSVLGDAVPSVPPGIRVIRNLNRQIHCDNPDIRALANDLAALCSFSLPSSAA